MQYNELKRLKNAEESLRDLENMRASLNDGSQIYQIRQTESSIQRFIAIAEDARESADFWSQFNKEVEVE